MKYGAALVVMAIGEQGRAVTAKDKAPWRAVAGVPPVN